MNNSIFSRIKTLINRVTDILSQGSLERFRLLRELNKGFKEEWNSGASSRLYSITTSIGNLYFAHELSTMTLRSGLKITIENDDCVSNDDYIMIKDCLLDKKSFVRQLMALGYDTLIIKGKNSDKGLHSYALKEYADLRGYMLNN